MISFIYSYFITIYLHKVIFFLTYEFVPASPAVSCMPGLSNLNSFRDRRQVAVQLASCGVLPPGLVQDCSQHSCAIAV